MTRTVSLPMYDLSSDAQEAFWTGLREHLSAAGLDDLPDALSAPADLHTHWRSPDTLLSQTCGFPLATSLAGEVRLVGTPRYTAPGCDGSDYASLVVVRRDDPADALADLRGRRAAINGRGSQSGCNALRASVAPHARQERFFAEVVESGGHARSLHLIRENVADVAAIDCVTYALLQRHAPRSTEGLRVLCVTDRAPGLPLITSLTSDDDELEALRRAFAAACRDPSLATARRAILLEGLEVRPLADYDRCLRMAAMAERLGYPVLR